MAAIISKDLKVQIWLTSTALKSRDLLAALMANVPDALDLTRSRLNCQVKHLEY
jgi:hypothetical protein